MIRLVAFALATAGLLLAAPSSKKWENLGKLNAGAAVEVVTNDRVERGEFVSSSDESLTIRTSSGEQRFARADVVRVVSRGSTHRLRNFLIGVGVGAAIGLVTDQTLGTYLRNESNPNNARALIWTLPIAAGGAIGAAIPSRPVIYRK